MAGMLSCGLQLPDDAVKTLRFGGFYAARARPGLRVLALNTNMFISRNFWLQSNHYDVEGYDMGDEVKGEGSDCPPMAWPLVGHADPRSWFVSPPPSPCGQRASMA